MSESSPSCATLYTDRAFMDAPGIGATVDAYRGEGTTAPPIFG